MLRRPWVAAFLLGSLLPSRAAPETGPDPAARLDEAVAAAETSLREGELQAAESRYRTALLEGWLLEGGLEAAAGHLLEAREAFRRASTAAVETARPLRCLALVHLQLGDASEAVRILARVVGRDPRDLEARALLGQALLASGQPAQAVQELEEAWASAPDELELAFTLASGYLRLKNVDAAERIFAQVAKRRPIPATHVLIGRTYRDSGEYDRAQAELRAALREDPRVPRAHYYLGTVALLAQRRARLEEAMGEFERELKLSPRDPLASLCLGMAMVEGRRPAAAQPRLELASRSEPPPVEAFHYLGRAQLALARPAEAAASLRRALELVQARGPNAEATQLGSIHYQLALALRRLGRPQEAAAHFAEAERRSATAEASARERWTACLGGSLEREAKAYVLGPAIDRGLSALTPSQRHRLERRVTTALARSYLNLGVMLAQRERFAQAAELFATAAEVDPAFPQVQYSLGVAYFNDKQFDKAAGPLAKALADRPHDAELRRMLALAWLNTEAYDKAAELLGPDPEREANPSLEYAYGLALVRGGRAAEAQAVFARLLADHGDSPELSVLLGQASAQQGDYDSAIAALERALKLKPGVAEASATLGIIYLKQGRLTEAEQALRAELAGHPSDLKSQHHLATVLDLEGRPGEALTLLRSVLESKPEFADARYLLGKILLAQGAAAEAVPHLEAAARLAPEEGNIRYQLAQAYQKLGKEDLAQQQFEVFRQLKDRQRGRVR